VPGKEEELGERTGEIKGDNLYPDFAHTILALMRPGDRAGRRRTTNLREREGRRQRKRG